MSGVLQILIGSAEPSATYSSEATALFAAMTVQPDATRKSVIDTFIQTMIADGVWAKIDALWVPRAHDAQAARLNWKSPSNFALTEVNSPTFTTDRGYTGAPPTLLPGKYLDTGWDPATNGSNFTQNSASYGLYLTPSIGTDTATNSAVPMGTNNAILIPRSTADNYRGFINSSSISVMTTTASTRLGLTVFNRSGATAVQAYRNGVSVGTDTETSEAPSANDFYLLGYNTGFSVSSIVDNQIGFAFVGGSLTSAEHADLDAALDTYITATT